MKWLQNIALFYLIALGGAVWGYGAAKWGWWPGETVTEVEEFAAGDAEETETTVVEKIQNDVGGKPTRKLVKYQAEVNHPKRTYKPLTLPKMKSRRTSPLVFLDDNAPKRLRFILGSFDFENNIHGAILLDETGQLIWQWDVHENGLSWPRKALANRTFPHGILVNSDGSIVFAFDNGASVQKFDRCSNRIWATRSGADHSLARDEKGQIWAIDSPKALQVFDAKTGRSRRRINMEIFLTKNPDVDPLGIRQLDYGTKWKWNSKGGSYWHPNDAEPLPAALADAFPQFEVGDLLVSFRSTNTVFVVSPTTYKIKWWRSGAWRRQHDPDWQPDGTITVYDNNMHRKVSRIIKIDPKTYKTSVLFDGTDEQFYTWMRGKHEIYSDGHIAISSPQQGRAFEVDQHGRVVFEFVNKYDNENTLIVSELIGLPIDYFDTALQHKCADKIQKPTNATHPAPNKTLEKINEKTKR